LREYNDLIARATKMGIKSPDSLYTDGKVKGKASKDTEGIGGQKSPEKADVFVKKVDLSITGLDTTQETESNIDHPTKKPSMNELPKFVKKSREMELPMFLEGFKPSKRR
jgi:hypothetical protein